MNWKLGQSDGANANKITDEKGDVVATVSGISYHESLSEAAADGRNREGLLRGTLMAAAPRLHDACRRALVFLDRPRASADTDELCGVLRAALLSANPPIPLAVDEQNLASLLSGEPSGPPSQLEVDIAVKAAEIALRAAAGLVPAGELAPVESALAELRRRKEARTMPEPAARTMPEPDDVWDRIWSAILKSIATGSGAVPVRVPNVGVALDGIGRIATSVSFPPKEGRDWTIVRSTDFPLGSFELHLHE
ncbi:MAG: hypothetical protein WCH79_16220 [Planctomycetia bacterium]